MNNVIDIKEKTIGFIGSGNMASAIITGLVKSKSATKPNITVYNRAETESLLAIKKKLSVNITTDFDDIINTDIIIIAVKPNVVESILERLAKSKLPATSFIISVASSISLSTYKKYISSSSIIRTMPNTSVSVLEGFTSIVNTPSTDEDALSVTEYIFNRLGSSAIIEENMCMSPTAFSMSL